MRRIRHAVDAQHGSRYRMHRLRDALDVVDGAEDVAGVRAGH